MNKIKQHRPAYFSGFEDEVAEFATKEELLALPFVKNFANQPSFYRFSVQHLPDYLGNNRDSIHLMAEMDNGFKWWVVGRLDNTTGIDQFPKWEPRCELQDD